MAITYHPWEDPLTSLPAWTGGGHIPATKELTKLEGINMVIPIQLSATHAIFISDAANAYHNCGPGILFTFNVSPSASATPSYGLGIEVDGRYLYEASNMAPTGSNYLVGGFFDGSLAGSGTVSGGLCIGPIKFKRSIKFYGYQTGSGTSTTNRADAVIMVLDGVDI